MIPSVNFHLWEPCNMRCQFCFATFKDVKHTLLPKGHLSRENAIEVVIQLAELGFEKITFAGGEPTLCPWLSELIYVAKSHGLTTMLVTNGSRLTKSFLTTNKKHLDWIALSVDSINTSTNIESGRAIIGKNPISKQGYYELVDEIKCHGYGLKINTVVSSKNFMEDLTDFIRYAEPKRWKVFQVLPIIGQNDLHINKYKIDSQAFDHFLSTHQSLSTITKIIPEYNHQMKGSYAMVDPAGRFYDNAEGKHHYSRPILEIGSRLAIQQVNYDFGKFIDREGFYQWHRAPSKSRITLSGEVASGKTKIGELLAKELGYKFVSLGNKTRELAASMGLSIVEFQEYCFQHPEMDLKLDREFAAECNNEKGLIIDYRMGYKFIEDSFNVFLKVSPETAIERLKKANRENETHETIEKRNNSFKNQFLNAYGEDYTDKNNYDLVIDTDYCSSIDVIVAHILQYYRK